MSKSAAVLAFTKTYNAWNEKRWGEAKYAKPHKFNDKSAKDLEKMIIAFFKIKNVRCWKVDVKGTMRERNGRQFYTPTKASKGVSDLFTVIDGHFLAIEVKIGSDKQSPKQQEFESDVIRQGGDYIIVRSFADFLKKMKIFTERFVENE